MDNNITLIGNATRDPELRFTTAGQANCTFGLAVNRRWQNKQTKEWEEQVSFFNVVCWQEQAENVAESVTKGARIMVNGRLQQREYTTDAGEKRNVVEVVADEVGPSLRWSTAVITRNERQQGSRREEAHASQAAAQSGSGYDDGPDFGA